MVVDTVLGDEVVTTGRDHIFQRDRIKILTGPDEVFVFVLLVFLIENILGSDGVLLSEHYFFPGDGVSRDLRDGVGLLALLVRPLV